MREIPTLMETALGGVFQDIGKFMQRAHGSVRQMAPQPRRLESEILPTNGRGGYTHKHVLWTAAFFHWMEQEGLSFPAGINREWVRKMAVYHHTPERFGALGCLAAEADRLSSGMDRKERDVSQEEEAEQPKGWDAFIRTAMLSPFQPVNLGLGEAPHREQPLARLTPGEDLLPVAKVDTSRYQQRYRELWEAFQAEFRKLCELEQAELFCEGLLSLSERYTFAIPSSTVDMPDISLHDHNRTVAAIAACLYAWHEHHGSLADAAAIGKREVDKFRLLGGDLSGIQHTLFLLASQQVKGVNRILRARSFLLGMVMEAAALRCRQRLGLPVFNLIQNAGGRFVMLVPDLPRVEAVVRALRQELDGWLQERYLGEMSLNLALSRPFSGRDLMPDRFPAVQDSLGSRLEEAKLQPLETAAGGVLGADYGEDGACTACGVRPAKHREDNAVRCQVCHDEHHIGGDLPHAVAITLRSGRDRGAVQILPDIWLCVHEQPPVLTREVLSGFRPWREKDQAESPLPVRFLANHVPRMKPGERPPDHLQDEDVARKTGDLKTFVQIADAARETHDGGVTGKPFLAVLKADVDRLGFLFGVGLSDPDKGKNRATLSRYAALSRMLDLFFTGHLQQRLRERFPDTYTVYAGGDDLLLIGPWRQTIDLARDLNEQFRRYTGDNPNITLSAGIALMRDNHPLNRAALEAEERLERAKDKGRDRICLLDEEPIQWDALPKHLAAANTLSGWLRDKLVSTALVYRLLYFQEQKNLAEGNNPEGKMDLRAANWRARWGYSLARNVREKSDKQIPAALKQEITELCNRLLGLDSSLQRRSEGQPLSPRIAASIALYRNRG